MRVFITVGSTRFDALIDAILTDNVLEVLAKKGYTKVVVQYGNSELNVTALAEESQSTQCLAKSRLGVDLTLWKFKPSLEEDCKAADLVISHAGSGTLLEVLRMNKPLIVVPNPTLLDNHQEELATALETLGHVKIATPGTLPQVIQAFDPSAIISFPPLDGSRFRAIIDEEMAIL